MNLNGALFVLRSEIRWWARQDLNL